MKTPLEVITPSLLTSQKIKAITDQTLSFAVLIYSKIPEYADGDTYEEIFISKKLITN